MFDEHAFSNQRGNNDMVKFQKGNSIGHRFTADDQPKNAGRKPALYKKLKVLTGKKVDHELSKEDYYNIIKYLIERSPNEMDALSRNKDGHANKDTPIWILNIISAINTDVRYGRTTTIDSLFDMFFGKATQAIEASISTPPKAKDMTEEEIREEINRIDNELSK